MEGNVNVQIYQKILLSYQRWTKRPYNDKTKLQVYVPRVMANIKKGTPAITKLPTKGYSVFKNEGKIPKMTNVILQEKNYLETDFNASSSIDDVANSSNNLIGEINSAFHDFASKNRLSSTSINKKIKFTIRKNTELRVEFLNGKLNKLAYTLMDKSKTSKELE